MFHAKHPEGQGRIRYRQGNTLVTWLKSMKMKMCFGFFKSLAYCRICSFSHTPRWVFVWKLGSSESPVVSVIIVFWFQVLVFLSVSWLGSSPHNTYILLQLSTPPASPRWAKEVMFIFALCMGNRGSCVGYDGHQVLDWWVLRQACMNIARSCFQWRPSSRYTSCQWREDGQGCSHRFQRKQPVLALDVLVSLSLPLGLHVSPLSIHCH